MPRRDPMEAQWPPAAARLLCYGCGIKFLDEQSKNRCRLCFDIFCSSCLAGEAHMPSSYGYSTPQIVCRTCQHLIALFPTFLGPLESSNSAATGNRAALLPPNYCVVILSSTITRDTTHDAGGSKDIGALGRLAQWVTKGARTFKCTEVKSLTLGAFRPINPDTKVCIGREFFLSIGSIVDVAAENSILTITVNAPNPGAPKEIVRVLIGSVPGLASASLIGRDALSAEGDIGDSNSMVFTVDPDAAIAVAASIKELRKHLKHHFSFSQSASCISQSMQKGPLPAMLQAQFDRNKKEEEERVATASAVSAVAAAANTSATTTTASGGGGGGGAGGGSEKIQEQEQEQQTKK